MINRVGKFKLFRWADGTRTLTVRTEGGGFFDEPPKLRGWTCFFVGRVGGSHTTWAYRRAS
jgi:hypothetical protein